MMKNISNLFSRHVPFLLLLLPCIISAQEADTAYMDIPFFAYDSVEVKPAYPGGEIALSAYLAQNLRYPDIAEENSISGDVDIWFVVERNGLLSNIKTLKGIGYGCDEEAERLVKNMPPWIPGKYKGVSVPVEVTQRIRFE